MVPIPSVGDGAPYRSPEELAAIEDKTEQAVVHTDAVDMRTRMCQSSGTPQTDAR